MTVPVDVKQIVDELDEYFNELLLFDVESMEWFKKGNTMTIEFAMSGSKATYKEVNG